MTEEFTLQKNVAGCFSKPRLHSIMYDVLNIDVSCKPSIFYLSLSYVGVMKAYFKLVVLGIN